MSAGVQSLVPGLEGEQRDRALSQYFTPPWLAERLWRWMTRPAFPRPIRVLEPSAGQGALLKPIATLRISVASVVAYEIDPRHVATLARLMAADCLPGDLRACDWLADPCPGTFDLACINPPYEGGQEITHTEKVLGCTARVGGIFRAAMLFGQRRHEFWRWTDIRRMALLSERPDFGGEHGAKADFVALDLRRRESPRLQGDACTSNVEWWMR